LNTTARAPLRAEPTMKAVVLKEFGGLENLTVEDLPIPRVGQGSILLRAAAASANPVDVSSPREHHSAHLSPRRSDATSPEP